jgi:uncharacterized membrane protein
VWLAGGRPPLRRESLGGTPGAVDHRRIDRILHLSFALGLIAKGIDGALEIVGGALLFFVTPGQLHHMARLLTVHELSEDPHDLIANYVLRHSRHLSAGAEIFGAVYLLGHGILKVGLVIALLLRRRWAYPVAIVAFLAFLLYELYRYSQTYAPELLVLSLLDVFVIALACLEYKRFQAPEVPS